jgi:hypothetical protein
MAPCNSSTQCQEHILTYYSLPDSDAGHTHSQQIPAFSGVPVLDAAHISTRAGKSPAG